LSDIAILIKVFSFRWVVLVASTRRDRVVSFGELERVNDGIGSFGDFAFGVLGHSFRHCSSAQLPLILPKS
jgi:hypothetical protein